MELIPVVIKAIEEKFDELREIRIKRQARIEAAYAEVNQKLIPKIDSMGRFHAPCDGYVDIDERGIYGKGEFLPIPEHDRDELCIHPSNKVFCSKTKILLPTAEGFDLKEALCANYGIDCSFGKRFERDGVEMAYLYMKGNDAMISAIQGAKVAFEEEEKAQRRALKGEAPEGKQVLKCRIVFIRRFIPMNQWDNGSDKVMVEFENKSTGWGTLPKAMADAEIGTEFNLAATFKRADDDNTHSFFSRPSVK